MAKKVVLFLTEGITDEISLQQIVSEIVNDNNVKFSFFETDITTNDRGVTPSNIKKRVREKINEKLREDHLRKSDLLEVIHLVDTDGAYIDECHMEEAEVDRFVYSIDKIQARDVEKIKERNEQKRLNLDELIATNYIFKDVHYKVFYFSCDLEHVLHDKINVKDREEKSRLANEFEELYEGREEEFITFINQLSLKSPGTYEETWTYIKDKNNSLKRFSNFHLFFEDR